MNNMKTFVYMVSEISADEYGKHRNDKNNGHNKKAIGKPKYIFQPF
ncbi:hypothetical protein [Niallia sp. BSM11]